MSNEEITTATVVIAGQFYDNFNRQLSYSEITVSYSSEEEVYHLPYESDGVDIELSNLTIYATDQDYHANVSKPSYFDIGCTELKYTIYLCPNGTACR